MAGGSEGIGKLPSIFLQSGAAKQAVDRQGSGGQPAQTRPTIGTLPYGRGPHRLLTVTGKIPGLFPELRDVPSPHSDRTDFWHSSYIRSAP